jgi:Tat protein translocase TatB subunit
MFDIGFTELVVIFVVALIAFGPKRLPEIAKAIGRGIAEVKNAMEDVKTQIDSEMHEVKKLKESVDLKNELNAESLLKPQEDPYEQPDNPAPAETETVNKEKGKV